MEESSHSRSTLKCMWTFIRVIYLLLRLQWCVACCTQNEALDHLVICSNPPPPPSLSFPSYGKQQPTTTDGSIGVAELLSSGSFESANSYKNAHRVGYVFLHIVSNKLIKIPDTSGIREIGFLDPNPIQFKSCFGFFCRLYTVKVSN